MIYPVLPKADTLIADKGYDSDAFREAPSERGITPCIPQSQASGTRNLLQILV